MKLRNIFTALAAAALAFVGCQQDEKFLEEVQVSKSMVALSIDGGSEEITVTAVDKWEIIGIPEWLTVSPVSGEAGKTTVSFSAAAAKENQEAVLHLNCGVASQVISVFQMAEKVDLPITDCATVLAENAIDKIYKCKGTITDLTNYNKYGCFYINDGTAQVYVYGSMNYAQFTPEVGDIITFEGPWTKYGNFDDVTILGLEKSLIKVEKVMPVTDLPVEGGVVNVVLTVKGEDLVVEVPEADTWLTVGEPEVIGTSTFVELTAAANEGDPRSTTVDFKTTSKGVVYTVSVTVKQKDGVIVEPTVATISSILALGANATIADDTFVEGVVVSNMDLNNLTSKKGLYVQDETAGLQFYLAANHEFKFGDKVKIDLSGAKVAAYNGAVQISGLALEKIQKLSSGNAVTPKTVSMADFLANKYESQYIALEGVQVVEADLAKTWGDPAGSSHTSIKMEDANGNNFVVFSSKYATYKSETVAQGSGKICGISSINNGTLQIIFAQTSDFAGLTGARLGAETPGEGGETPGEGGEQVTERPFTSNVSWKADKNKKSYDDGGATINGQTLSKVLKLGTSSAIGEATITVPAGTKKVGFWGVAWNGKKGTIVAEVAGTQIYSQDLKSNTGAANSAPYTMTVTDSDYYELTLDAPLAAETVVTLKTVSGATRVILWGINAY